MDNSLIDLWYLVWFHNGSELTKKEKEKKETHNTVRHRNENVLCIRLVDRRISTNLSVPFADGIGWKSIAISFPRRSKAANIFTFFPDIMDETVNADELTVYCRRIVTFAPLFHKSGSAELLKFSSGFSILRYSTLLSFRRNSFIFIPVQLDLTRYNEWTILVTIIDISCFF